MNENINSNNNQNDISIDSLTVDYNNLYKLESTNNEKEKIQITDQDLQFDKGDHIEDQAMVDKIEKEDTKHNIIFMVIIVLILIIVILFFFPLFIKLKLK